MSNLIAVGSLVYRLLRFSPSYQLARLTATGEISNELAARLPEDFLEVQRTFQKLGPVQILPFERWWRNYGVKAFGAPPLMRQVGFIDGTDTDYKKFIPNLQWHFESERLEDGDPDALLLAVPIGMPINEARKQLTRMLELFSVIPHPAVQTLELEKNLTDTALKILERGVELLERRAASSSEDMWRFGARAVPSKASYVGPNKKRVLLDAAAPPQPKDQWERDGRIFFATSINRDLQKFARMAENTARGRFPTADPVPPIYSEALGAWIGITGKKGPHSRPSVT